MTESSPLAPVLQYFFTEHLHSHKQVSPKTVLAYRDSFRLLLQFVRDKTKKMPSSLCIQDLDAPVILKFLDSLEQERKNQVCSRNARLAAIRSFFRVVALRDPASVGVVTRVLSIPIKRTDKRLVGYLTREEMDAVLAAPDQSQWLGKRDHALLLTMYNSGGRLSEMTALKRDQVIFGPTTYLHLKGKGRKEREVPLWPKTSRFLQQWFRVLDGIPTDIAFPTTRGTALSADTVNYVLKQAVKRALPACSTLASKRVTPHVLRHTTAMHLMQSGVDITVIALWLGHESIETTHKYLEADLATKERALERIAPGGQKLRRFKADDKLLAFLASI
jgi:site-specific recombinase XerD